MNFYICIKTILIVLEVGLFGFFSVLDYFMINELLKK